MIEYSGESLQTFTETLSSNVSTWWNQNGGTDSMSPGVSTVVYAVALNDIMTQNSSLQYYTGKLLKNLDILFGTK